MQSEKRRNVLLNDLAELRRRVECGEVVGLAAFAVTADDKVVTRMSGACLSPMLALVLADNAAELRADVMRATEVEDTGRPSLRPVDGRRPEG